MAKSILISVDKNAKRLLMTGNTVEVLNNNRMRVSLRRLNFEERDSTIMIPFETENQVEILQDLQQLLTKFGFPNDLSSQIKNELENYSREEEHFREFSEKARKIRNDEFEGNPKLISDFDAFQRIVKEKLPQRVLYKLQLLSAYHLAFAQSACNFAVPGAGKTSIVYAAYAYLKNLPPSDPKHIDKLLIIGPLSSFLPWESEYEACFGSKPISKRLSGDNTMLRRQKEEHLYSTNPAEITLIYHGGVNTLQKEIIDFLKNNKTMVVVDEAHRIKNPEGVWGKSIVEIAKEARSRVVLTGTPVPNGYEDLYNLYQFLYPYRFKEILGFHFGNLVDMTKNGNPDSERVKQFTKNIAPYFIRIKKRDLQLPLTNERIIEVEMDPHQREIYDFIETKYIRSFRTNGSATIKDILNKAKLIRLRQAATNPSLLQKSIEETLDKEDETTFMVRDGIPKEFQDDSTILEKIRDYSSSNVPRKFESICKLLNDEIVKKKQKAIIWTIFIQNAKELRSYLENQGIPSKLLIGEVDQSDREKVVAKFNDPRNQEFQVVIANPFAVAESISLHKGCHNAIYMERDYNCSNFLQSKDRIHRVGLLENQETNYYYLLSKESIDEVIKDRLDMKVKRMEKIIDEDIPLFGRIDNADETDLIKALIENYATRT